MGLHLHPRKPKKQVNSGVRALRNREMRETHFLLRAILYSMIFFLPCKANRSPRKLIIFK